MTNHGRRDAMRPSAPNMRPRYRRPCVTPGYRVTRRIRSSPARGSVRPSRLEVVTHSDPSGARATERIRPYSPAKCCCGLPRVGAVEDDGPDALALQGAEPGPAGRDRDPARRALVDRPLGQRVGVPALAVGALDVGPAVVLARPDQVELVGALVAELGGPQPAGVVEADALDVAVAVAPGQVVERVAVRDVAGVGHPQHLAVDRVGVLGAGRVLGVAGGGVQQPVRPEGQAAAVVVGRGPDAGQDRLRLAEPAVVGHPDDPVVVVGGEVGVEQPVLVERRVQRQPEQPGLAALVEPAAAPRGCRPRSALPSETRSSRPVSRSPTSAVPSGRNAMPHGTASPVTTSPATCGSGAADAVGLGAGVAVSWGRVGVGLGACGRRAGCRGGLRRPAGPLVAAARRQRGQRGARAAAQQHPPRRPHAHVTTVGRVQLRA